MPIPLVKKLAGEKGIDLPEAEKRWEKAKKIAEEQAGLSETDGEDYWKYVVGVFKKSMGAGEGGISESADVQPWDKERLSVAYPQRVREARSFSDILVIFSALFPYAVDSRLWEGEYEAAKRFRVLFEEFQAETDMELKYETAQEMGELANANRFKSAFETMAGPGLRSGDLVMFSNSSIGGFLLKRNCEDGERMAGSIIPGYGEKLKTRNDIQASIDQIQKDYDFLVADQVKKKKDEMDAIRKDCGALDLQTRAAAMNDEHWEWVGQHSKNIPPYDSTEYAKWKQELDDYNDGYEKQFRALMDKSYELEDLHVKPVRDKWNAELKEAGDRKEKEIHVLKMAQQEIDDMVGGAIIAKIMEMSPVSKEEADQWSKSQRISKSAVLRLKKQGYEEGDFREHMAEFYRLTGGRVGKAFIETKGDKRAKAAFWDGTIYIDGRFKKRTLFHEMGHLLERESKLESMAESFRDSRAKKESGTRTLRSITKNPGYRSDEVAYTDDFFDAYIGKVYRYKATEVLSMGMQMFGNPGDAAFLAGRDPQMFNMMVGFMASKPTARELSKKEKIQEVAADTMSERDTLEKFYQVLARKAKDDSFWEGKGSLISSLEGYGRGKGSGKTMALYYYPGDPQGPGSYAQSNFFKTRQTARNFAYLYLLYVQKGIISDRNEASNLSYQLVACVQGKTMPPRLKTDDLPTFIEDLQ